MRPARLLVPAASIDVPLIGLGISSDGTLQAPKSYQQVGWLRTSPAPGQRGPAIIAGHVDSTTGPAPFYRLRELKQGDRVIVVRGNGSRVSFTVDAVQRYAKSAFPTATVYGPVPGPALRLLTCGGQFDRTTHHYRENVVVYAS